MIRISPLLLLILLSFTDHVGSVVLTRSPLTASDGELFTLICSSNTSSGQDRQWYIDDVFVFTTTQGSSSPSISNPDVFKTYLAGRVNVSCDVLQHNVTLRIISDTDNGTRWKCLDNSKSQTSHTVPIRVVNLMTVSSTSTTTTAATTATTATSATATTTTTTANFDSSSSTSLQGVDAPNVVYIAVGAAVGGVVVGCVIIIIVVIIWMRRRNTSKEDDASAPNIYTSPSHSEDMGHQYGKVEMQYINTVGGIRSGSPYSVNAEDKAGNAAYYNTAGQHQHRDEDANTGDTTYYNTACDADN